MKLTTITAVALTSAAALFSMSVSAKGDIEAGKAKVQAVCSACHGLKGHAQIPSYPNLAGQNEQYIIKALEAYRSKQRQGGQAIIMQAQASQLSDQDIENVAAYFSSLKP